MSALQLQILLEHICDKDKRQVYFTYKPEDSSIRLHIWFNDNGGNQFHRSFGPHGRFTEHEV